MNTVKNIKNNFNLESHLSKLQRLRETLKTNCTPIRGSEAGENVAVTLPSSSGVSCAVCSPSLVLSRCSCTDGGASGTETDAAERRTTVTFGLTGLEHKKPKV